MQNTVTSYLQKENINYIQKFDVPVVIYSYVPEQWWDNTDRVPNALRYHFISNYIYNNYKPFTVLNGHFVWIRKGMKPGQENYPALDSSLVGKQLNYELKNLPFLLGKDKQIGEGKIIAEWQSQKNDSNSFVIPQSFNKSHGNHLDLIIENPGEQVTAILSYLLDGKTLGTFSFLLSGGTSEKNYRIPISTQWNWHYYNPDNFILTFSAGKANFKKAFLKEGGI
jgi:hypothetical protein